MERKKEVSAGYQHKCVIMYFINLIFAIIIIVMENFKDISLVEYKVVIK